MTYVVRHWDYLILFRDRNLRLLRSSKSEFFRILNYFEIWIILKSKLFIKTIKFNYQNIKLSKQFRDLNSFEIETSKINSIIQLFTDTLFQFLINFGIVRLYIPHFTASQQQTVKRGTKYAQETDETKKKTIQNVEGFVYASM